MAASDRSGAAGEGPRRRGLASRCDPGSRRGRASLLIRLKVKETPVSKSIQARLLHNGHVHNGHVHNGHAQGSLA